MNVGVDRRRLVQLRVAFHRELYLSVSVNAVTPEAVNGTMAPTCWLAYFVMFVCVLFVCYVHHVLFRFCTTLFSSASAELRRYINCLIIIIIITTF